MGVTASDRTRVIRHFHEDITMFSVNQKREISRKIQEIIRETNHSELPDGEINFKIHIDGAENWSWADIENNGSVTNPSINPHNERQAL